MARQTARFWQWYIQTANPDTRNKLFIDGFRLFNGKLTGANQSDPFSNNDGNGNSKSEYYYKPTGVDPGVLSGENFGPTSGELGRIFLSFPLRQASNPQLVQNSFSQPGFEETDSARLAQHMQGTGNFFRFTDDPTNSIYKIVGQPDTLELGSAKNFAQLQDCGDFSSGAVSELANPSTLFFQADGTGQLMDTISDNGYQGPGTFSEPTLENFIIGGANGQSVNNGVPACNPLSSLGSSTASTDLTRVCQREGFRVEFRKVDDSGNLINSGTRGIDTTTFDPRSMVCHDGRESLRISIVNAVNTGGEVAPTENAALFETEPKEDIGLDLYYEASNAIPMRLSKTNASYFAPYKSKVTSAGPDGFTTQILANTHIDHQVSHIGFTENSVIIAVKSLNVANNATDLALHAVTGDMLSLIHI